MNQKSLKTNFLIFHIPGMQNTPQAKLKINEILLTGQNIRNIFTHEWSTNLTHCIPTRSVIPRICVCVSGLIRFLALLTG